MSNFGLNIYDASPAGDVSSVVDGLDRLTRKKSPTRVLRLRRLPKSAVGDGALPVLFKSWDRVCRRAVGLSPYCARMAFSSTACIPASVVSEFPRCLPVCVSGIFGNRGLPLRRGRRREKFGPLRRESATMALRDDESGDVNAPGYIVARDAR